MASKRFVALLKAANGIDNASTPIAYDREADALAAAILANPNGGYRIVDSWKLDYVKVQTTSSMPIMDLSVNENEAVNYFYQASETWPI